MAEPLVYWNGRLVPGSRARLALNDAGLVLGATVTERVRTFNKRLFRLEEHFDRLYRSLRSTGIDSGLPRKELSTAANQLAAHNSLLLDEKAELGLVIFITPGELPGFGDPAPAAGPTVCIHTFPLDLAPYAARMQHGEHLVIPTIRQVPPECIDPRVKHRSRLHYYLADREVRQIDPEASALLLDLAGNVTETGRANFLIVERGFIVSPPPTHILPGVTRAVVMELAGRLGIPFAERPVRLYDLLNAEEAFTASTTCCLLPVTRVNGRPIGTGKPGPVYNRLLEAWNQEVGLDIRAQIVEAAARPTPPPSGPGPAEALVPEAVARQCTTPVHRILEQVPSRLADRSFAAPDRSAVVLMALWSLLHWERKIGRAALEALRGDLPALVRDLDALLDRKRDAPRSGSSLSPFISVKDQPAPVSRGDLPALLRPLLERAAEEARALGHDWVGTEHLLLAVLALADPELSVILGRHRVVAGRVKEAVLELLRAGKGHS